MRPTTLTAWLSEKRVGLALGALTGWMLLATLPYLSDFPLVDWAQPMIAAPAYKLVSQGIYGSDMFTGFYRSEWRNYDHMPLYPMLLAVSFKMLGTGVWQARLVSVFSGLVVVWLTFALGRRLYGASVGLAAAGLLCVMRLGLPNPYDVLRLGYQMNASGIPLLDFARVIRFDVLVPAWVVAAGLCFYRAQARDARRWYLAAGACAGLATLTHLYGGFVLAVLILAHVWHAGRRAFRRAPLVLMLAGCALVMLPYVVYALQDIDAYRGQMLRHEARFDLLNPAFYLDSLGREPWRYLSWLGGSLDQAVWWPRVGLWVMAAGVAAANLVLVRRIRHSPQLADRLLLISLPVLAGLLGLLINVKRYPYTSLLMPFIALQVGLAIVAAWRSVGRHRRLIHGMIGVALAALTVEGAAGIANSFQMGAATTPYQAIVDAVRRAIPSGARVVSSHVAWFGLAGYDMRSANLVFVLSDPQYGYARMLSVDEVLQHIDPEYIVMEDRLLKTYLREPASLPDERVVTLWRMFDEYIQRHCGDIAARVPAPDYGDVTVYHCR